MSDSNDPKEKSDSLDPPDANEGKRSGRVTFDSRGNSVWEWQLETGVYSRDVNTQKLKKLDLGELSIAETAIQKGPEGLEERASDPGGGVNPYDSAPRQKQEGFNPYDNARALGRSVENRFAPKSESKEAQPAGRSPPKSLDELRKLSEWIKQKRKLEGK